MSTVFEKIISGEWSGRFAWADDDCVAISTIEPTAPGHTLVIPRHPWDKWTDVPSDVRARLFEVAAIVGRAQEAAFGVARSGLVIAGFDVPHTHVHVIPLRSEKDLDLGGAAAADPEALDEACERLRSALREAGHGANVPVEMGSPRLD